MPYFARKLCDGSYGRAEIRDKIKQLYAESLETDGNDFVDAVSEFISDSYDHQRVTKRISSGMISFYYCVFIVIMTEFLIDL